MLETALNQMESTTLDTMSPPPHNLQKPIKSPVSQNTAAAPCKSVTPSRLKVPKAFKYPERFVILSSLPFIFRVFFFWFQLFVSDSSFLVGILVQPIL